MWRLIFKIPKSTYKPCSVFVGSSIWDACCQTPRAVYPRFNATGRRSPLLDLASRGGYLAAAVTNNAGVLLPHRFTLAFPEEKAIHFSVALYRRITPPGRYPARYPVKHGLSSMLT